MNNIKQDIAPRLIRLKNAPKYLGTTKNIFNKTIRPYLKIIRIGNRGIAFDRLDLDRWIEHNKGRGGTRPNNGGISLWGENARQDSTNAEVPGTLINRSSVNEFWKILEQVRSKKPKKC